MLAYRPFSRSHRNGWISLVPVLLLTCCLASALQLSGCALSVTHAEMGSHTSTQQLLDAFEKNFAQIWSLHVVMSVQNPGLAESGHVQIRGATANIVLPDKVQAHASVIFSGQPVSVDLISIGQTQYITDPITGEWNVARGIFDPRIFTHPRSDIESMITEMQNITPPTSDYIDGRPCWRINGWLAAKHLSFLGGGVPDDTELQASSCLGKSDSLPYQVSITGWATHGDTLQTSRTFLFSKYNENMYIHAPLL